MSDSGFIGYFKNSMESISKDYNLPQFALDDDYRCKLKYNDQFDLEIIGNPEGCLQMHAHILPFHLVEKSNKALRKLLESNVSDSSLSGCYLGINKAVNSVCLNSVVYMKEIDTTDLMTILHNFISKADAKKSELERTVSNLPSDPVVQGSKPQGYDPTDPLHLLNRFV